MLSGLLIWTKRTALATLHALKRSHKAPRQAAAVAALQAEMAEGNQ